MFMSQKEKARDADHIHAFSEPQASSFRAPKDKVPPSQSKEKKLPSQSKENASPSISEEWEKLIIIDDDDFCTPATSSRVIPKPSVSILPSPVKPLDEKTSRILERLEAPKAKKQRASKPPSTTSSRGGASSTQVKKPLLPFEPTASQPLKPTFNRLRRKPAA